jgi:DNA repair exonuclease SbcCD ATPase subunit
MADAGEIKYTVNVDSDEAQKNLNKTAETVDNLGDKIEEVDKKSSFENLKKGTKSVSEAVAKFVIESIKGFSDMQSEIAKATGATGKDLEDLTKVANTALADLTQSQEEVGRAVGELNTRLALQGESLQEATVQIGNFARITGQDMQQATIGVTKLMATWNIQADKLPKILDKLAVAGQKTGKNVAQLTAELQQNYSILNQFGLSIDEATSFLMSLESQGIESSTALGAMRMALMRAGQSGQDVRKVWDEMTKSIQNATSKEEAMQIASQTLGRSAGQLVSVIQEGKLSFNEFAKDLENSEGIVESTAKSSMSLSQMLQQLSNIANSLIGGMQPVLQPILDLLKSMLPLISTVSKQLAPAIESLAGLLEKVANWTNRLIRTQEQADEENRKVADSIRSQALAFIQSDEAAQKLAKKIYDLQKENENLQKKVDKANETGEDATETIQKMIDNMAECTRTEDELITITARGIGTYEDYIKTTGVLRESRLAFAKAEKETAQAEMQTQTAIKQKITTMQEAEAAIARLKDLQSQQNDILDDNSKAYQDLQFEIDGTKAALMEFGLTEKQINEALGDTSGAEAQEESLEQLMAKVQKYLGYASQFSSMLGSALGATFTTQKSKIDKTLQDELTALSDTKDAELAEIEEFEENRTRAIQNALNQGLIDNEEYNEAIAQMKQSTANRQSEIEKKYKDKESQLNQDALKKKNEIAKKEFETNKALNIANAVINAAQAVIRCFTDLGPIGGAIAAGAITALTGVQIAAIAQEEFVPSYDTGSGVLGSDRFAQLHRGERVLNKADTARLERMGGLSAIQAGGATIPLVINLNSTLEADGERLAQVVLSHYNEAQRYV